MGSAVRRCAGGGRPVARRHPGSGARRDCSGRPASPARRGTRGATPPGPRPPPGGAECIALSCPFPRSGRGHPCPRTTSSRRRPMSSDTLSPVWIATNSRARSRRPIQVARSGAASSASISSGCEVFDQSPLVALAGDGEDAAALVGVGRLLERDVVEEGMDRRQACVPAPGAVTAFLLEVIEEVADEGCVQILEGQLRRGLPQSLCGEPQEQAKGVAVSGDGVRAGPALPQEAVGEEGLDQTGEVGARPSWLGPPSGFPACVPPAPAAPGRPRCTSTSRSHAHAPGRWPASGSPFRHRSPPDTSRAGCGRQSDAACRAACGPRPRRRPAVAGRRPTSRETLAKLYSGRPGLVTRTPLSERKKAGAVAGRRTTRSLCAGIIGEDLAGRVMDRHEPGLAELRPPDLARSLPPDPRPPDRVPALR